jgi:glycine/D-amino acid oxidase-like deaminating enzyme
MGSEHDYDVVVVGAGAVGCSTARELATDHDVLVLEKDRLGDSASANASAFISNWWYFLQGDHIPGVFETVREFFHELDGTGEFVFNEHPYMLLIDEERDGTEPSEQVKQMKDNTKHIDDLSYHGTEQIEERWPDMFKLDGFEGGIVDDGAGYIDPLPYLGAMKEEAEDRGAEFRMETKVTSIETEDGAVSGVTVDDGSETIGAETVVVAAGTYSEKLVSDFTSLPTKDFMICGHRILPNRGSPEDIPITTGRGLFVGTDAFGSLTLAGGEYWIDDISQVNEFPEEFPEEAREHVADRLPRVLKGYETETDIQYTEDGQHRCPEGITITPDQIPVIDKIGGIDGLVVADGSRGAVSLAPAMSTVARSLITGEESPIPHEPFRIDRFGSESHEFDLPLITEPPT